MAGRFGTEKNDLASDGDQEQESDEEVTRTSVQVLCLMCYFGTSLDEAKFILI